MELLLWVIAGVVIVTVLAQIVTFTSQSSLREGAINWMDAQGITQYRVTFDPGDAIGVDYEGKRVAVTIDGKNFTIPFSALISVEISEDGTTISKTNRGSQALGTAIGAVALGGVGAVIGGLSASSTTAEKVSKATLNLITSLPDSPYIQVKVFSSAPTDKRGFTYTTLTKEMMPWYGRLKAIIETQ